MTAWNDPDQQRRDRQEAAELAGMYARDRLTRVSGQGVEVLWDGIDTVKLLAGDVDEVRKYRELKRKRA